MADGGTSNALRHLAFRDGQPDRMHRASITLDPGFSRQVSDDTSRSWTRERPSWTREREVHEEATQSTSGGLLPCFHANRHRLRTFVSSSKFDAAIGVVIIVNSVTIALEQTWTLEGKDAAVLDAADNGFLVIYVLELVARFGAFGALALKDGWVFFDSLLVVIGVATNWVLLPFFGSNLEALGMAMVLRVARLLRLTRTVRLLIKFRELWMLVRGLINSAATMLYTAVILFAAIFIFSSIGIELVTKHPLADPVTGDPVFREIVSSYFSNLPHTMLTILQFATLDDIDNIYRPLIRKSPWLFTYFGTAILVVSIVLMNLITAVVVNAALEAAMQDKEMLAMNEQTRKKKLIQDVSAILARLDPQGTGLISKSDFLNVSDEDRVLLEQMVYIGDPIEIFETLDVENSGELSIQEFCDGIWQVVIAKGSIEVKRTEKKVDSLKSQLEGLKTHINTSHEKLFDAVRELRDVVDLPRPAGRVSYTSPAWARELSKKITLEMEAIKSLLQEQSAALLDGRRHLENCDVSHAALDTEAVTLDMKDTVEPSIVNWTSSAPLALKVVSDDALHMASGVERALLGTEEVATCNLLETLINVQSGNEFFRQQLEAAENALVSYMQTLPETPLRLATTSRARKTGLARGHVQQPLGSGPVLNAVASSPVLATGDSADGEPCPTPEVWLG